MNQKKIYVSSLSYDTKENDLESHFNQFGSINDVKLILDRDTGRSRGFAFIEFNSNSSAEKALKSDGAELMGRNIQVSIARDKER